MFHKKNTQKGRFDGKGLQKLISEILLHLTKIYSGRLLHYVVVKNGRF